MRAYAEAYLSDVVENQGKLFDFVAQSFPDKNTEDFMDFYIDVLPLAKNNFYANRVEHLSSLFPNSIDKDGYLIERLFKSKEIKSTCPWSNARNFFSAACAFRGLRQAKMTCCPFFTSCSAVAKPIPVFAPVIKIFIPMLQQYLYF